MATVAAGLTMLMLSTAALPGPKVCITCYLVSQQLRVDALERAGQVHVTPRLMNLLALTVGAVRSSRSLCRLM